MCQGRAASYDAGAEQAQPTTRSVCRAAQAAPALPAALSRRQSGRTTGAGHRTSSQARDTAPGRGAARRIHDGVAVGAQRKHGARAALDARAGQPWARHGREDHRLGAHGKRILQVAVAAGPGAAQVAARYRR